MRTSTGLFRVVAWLLLLTMQFQAIQPAPTGFSQTHIPAFSHGETGSAEALLRGLVNFLVPRASAQGGDPLLASTPEFALDDPYLVAKAAELGHDADQVYAFVRDDIGYEAYRGSLRGARGTLWSGAGNALDKASLLVALLRISGIPAEYVRGTLAEPDAATLLESMFTDPLRIVGCFDPATTPVADPASDPALLAEAGDHFWVRANGQDYDPGFPGAQPGDVFAVESGSFAEVPEALRHQLTVRLLREITLPLSGLFGAPSQDVAPVLEETFAGSELVGRTLTLGHFVESSTAGFVISATTTTYSPYLIVGGDGLDSADDEVLRGTDYQEVLTNFPFGSQVATGLFLEIDDIAPGGAVTTYRRTLKDRIGKAVRENGAADVALDIDPEEPFITPVDLVTVAVPTSRYAGPGFDELETQVNAVLDEFNDFSQQVLADPDNVSTELTEQANTLVTRSFIATARSRLAQFAILSQETTTRMAAGALVNAYHDSPKITLFQSEASLLDDDTVALRFGLDLRKNTMRVVPAPGQNPAVRFAFNANRGFSDTWWESRVLGQFDPGGGDNLPPAVSAFSVIDLAVQQGIPMLTIAAANAGDLDGLGFPADAKAWMSAGIAAGKVLMLPSQAVIIDGQPRVAWYESDPETGETIGVLDNGGHQALVDSVGARLNAWMVTRTSEFGAGMVAGMGVGSMFNLIKFLGGIVVANTPGNLGLDGEILQWKNLIGYWFNIFLTTVDAALNGLKSTPYYWGFLAGVNLAFFISDDPPLEDVRYSPPPLPDFDGLDGSGVAAAIAGDPFFTLPVSGAQFPVFRIGIRNTGAGAGTFDLEFAEVPAGFTGRTTVGSMEIPAGETAEVGVCLLPGAGLPPPGTPADFSLRVTNRNQPAVSALASHSFAVPVIRGVALSSTPANLNTSPGVPVQTDLVVQAVGNTPVDITLDAVPPPGLDLAGLAPVTLAPGETSTQALTLTPDGIPLNTSLVAQVQAEFGGVAPQTLGLPLQVVVPGAESVGPGAEAALKLGLGDLAAQLDGLGTSLTNLVGDPENPVFAGQVLAALDLILDQLPGNPDLAGFAAALQAARDALANAGDGAAVLLAVNQVGAALDTLNAGIVDLARYTFTIGLLPNTAVAQPQVPVEFRMIVQNTGAEQATYDLAVAGLPAGVTGNVTPAFVTLAPGASTAADPPVLAITQTSTTELQAFPFTVTAAVQGTVPAITRAAEGSLTVRREVVSVVAVTPDPPFAEPGDPVQVSTRLLNAVNTARSVQVHVELEDGGGQVLFSSEPVPAALTLQTSLLTVGLGTLPTSGLAQGDYRLLVIVEDPAAPGSPLATGEGALLIGSPVTASLAAAPDLLPPGNGSTTVSLQINSQLNAVPPLTLLGQLPVTGGATGVAVKDDLAYVCGGSGINVVDISNPAIPSLIKTVGTASRGCLLQGDLLLAYSGLTPSFTLRVYSIAADPETPVLLGSSPAINYNLPFDLKATATTAYVAQLQYCYFLGNLDIFQQFGDVLSIALNLDDADNPTAASPALLDVLFNNNGDSLPAPGDVAGCPASGGNNNAWQLAEADANTLLPATTTATGTSTHVGVGRILSVDRSNPAQLAVVNELLLPGMVQATGIALDGDRALVMGSTGGLDDFGDLILTGDLVFVVLDVSNPLQPLVLGSRTTTLPARTFWNNLTALGGGLYALARGVPGAGEIPQPELVLVNIDDPDNIVVGTPMDTTDTVVGANGLRRTGDLLLATASSAGLLVYQIGATPTIPVTASVEIPNGTGVSAGSFNVAPTTIVPGADFDTLNWELAFDSGNSSQTLTWQAALTALQPGESRPVTGATTIDFMALGVAAEIDLPPVAVASDQVLALAPASRSVPRGAAADYSLFVGNPAPVAVTYGLGVQGVPASWVSLPPSVDVPAEGEVEVPLTLTSDAFAVIGDHGFVVNAVTGGVTGSVGGNLNLLGPVVLSPALAAQGVVLAITPVQATAGRGTPAFYQLRITNVGSQPATFDLAGNFPAGFQAEFASPQVSLLPGAGNYQDVLLALTPPPSATPGNYGFSVSAADTADPGVDAQASAGIDVVNLGVAVDLSSSGPDEFTLRVTNTGLVTDTFNLSLGGPLALYATLSQTAIALDPGEFGDVPISIAGIDNAVPGTLTLIGTATAGSNADVHASDSSDLAIAVQRGLEVSFDPASQVLAGPGAAQFILNLKNTGNREEVYRASISAVDGPVTAALRRVDGPAVDIIDGIRLTALGSGKLFLNANLLAAGSGEVTVSVATNGEPSVAGTAVASLSTDDPPPPPTSPDPVVIPVLDRRALLLLALLMVIAAAWARSRRRQIRG